MPLKKNPKTGGYSGGKIGTKTKMTKQQVLAAVRGAFASGYKGEDSTGIRSVRFFGNVKGESFNGTNFEETGNVTDLIVGALSDELSTFAEYTAASVLMKEVDEEFSKIIQDIANEEVTDHFITIANQFGIRAKLTDIYTDMTLTAKGISPQIFIGAIAAEDDAILTYTTLAQVMPELASFWNEIKDDEIEHRERILEHWKKISGETPNGTFLRVGQMQDN